MLRRRSTIGLSVAILGLWGWTVPALAQTPAPGTPPPPAAPPPTAAPTTPPAEDTPAPSPEPEQTAEPAEPALEDYVPEPQAEPELARGDDIVVTGSRLKRTAFSSSSPVTVVNREELERAGYSDLSELSRNLNEGGGSSTGGSGATTTGAYYQNQGVQMINLRGLGPNATLVLINGRRMLADGPGGALENFSNLATIPISMIERVEVLRGGASAIYGSDAVAGVVNIITRKKLTGVHIEANALSTDTFDHQQYSSNLSMGASNDTSSVSVGLSWYHSTPLYATDRDWTEGQYQTTIGPMGLYVPIARSIVGPDGMPQYFADDIGSFELFPDPQCPDPKGFLNQDHTQQIANLQAQAMQFPMGSDQRELIEKQIVQYQTAQRFVGRHKNRPEVPYFARNGYYPTGYMAGDARNQQEVIFNDANGFGCGWQTREYNVLMPEDTRINSMLFASHSFNDHLEVKLESQYADSRTKAMVVPTLPYINGLAAAFTPDSVYDDDTPWTAPITDDNGNVIPQSIANTLYYGYPFNYGSPPNYNRYGSQAFRSVLAIHGDFAAAAAGNVVETWEWEVSGTYSRSTWQSRVNDFNSQDVSRAINNCAVTADGMLKANPALENTPENRQSVGCFNPFYTAFNQLGSQNAPGLIDDLLTEVTNLTISELYTADATLNGAVFELPGGDLKFALGGQYRYEKRSSDYDNDTNQNRTNFYTGIDDTSNSRDVWSAYAELDIPLIKAFELQPAIRYEAYEGSGSALSPQVGAILSIGNFFDEPPPALENLRVRGTYARAFRAPNLAQTDADACSYVSEFVYSPRTNPDPAIRRTQTTQLITGKVCGSDSLVPEESDSYSAGIDWTWGRLHAQLDYWVYNYRERIIQPVMQRTIDVNANRAYCLIDRSADQSTQSAEGRALVNNINGKIGAANGDYFKNVNCADVAAKEGVAQNSLSSDQFVALYGDELRYLDTTGTPRSPTLRYDNASQVLTNGLDFGFVYSLDGQQLGLDGDVGTLSLGLQGSYILNFEYREAPEDPTVDCAADPEGASCLRDAAGNRNVRNFNHVLPRLRFSVPISYAIGQHNIAFTTRYISGFEDDAITGFDIYNAPSKQVAAFVVYDLQYALNLGPMLGTGAEWRIGIQNLLDTDPPRIRQWDSGGYEPGIHDGRGRLFYTRVAVDL
jgi:outer membrane receptor protein involved in Fe transport